MNTKLLLLAALLQIGSAGSSALAQDAPAPASTPPATQPGVTLVNLHLKQAMPEDVFFMLGKQGGVKFTPNGNVWDQESMQVPADIDFTDRPFWSAVREACSIWRLTLQSNYNSGRRISVNAPPAPGSETSWRALPYFESQGYLVEAVGFNQNLNYNNLANSFCAVQLRVYVDPALRVQSFGGTSKVDEAMDNAGHSMLREKGGGMSYGGGSQRSFVYDSSVPLKYPSENAGKKIAILKCIVQLRGGDKLDSLTVDDPLKANQVTKDFGDMKIAFKSLRKQPQGNNYELKVTVTHEDDDGRGGNNDWQLIQSGQMLDSAGRAFNYSGGGGGSSRGGVYNYNVTYTVPGGEDAPSGDPAKWTIELPMNTHVIRVPVEFKDLPMP